MKKRLIFFYILLVLSLAINIFILVEGAIAGDDSASQSFSITQMVIDIAKSIDPESVIAKDPETTHAVIRKLVGHFGLFAIDGVITTSVFLFIENALEIRKKEIAVTSFTIGLAVAFFSELFQLFTPGRFMSVVDMLIDLAGYIGVGGLFLLIAILIHSHKKKKENN